MGIKSRTLATYAEYALNKERVATVHASESDGQNS